MFCHLAWSRCCLLCPDLPQQVHGCLPCRSSICALSYRLTLLHSRHVVPSTAPPPGRAAGLLLTPPHTGRDRTANSTCDTHKKSRLAVNLGTHCAPSAFTDRERSMLCSSGAATGVRRSAVQCQPLPGAIPRPVLRLAASFNSRAAQQAWRSSQRGAVAARVAMAADGAQGAEQQQQQREHDQLTSVRCAGRAAVAPIMNAAALLLYASATAVPCMTWRIPPPLLHHSANGLPRTAVLGVLGGGQLGRMMALAAVRSCCTPARPWLPHSSTIEQLHCWVPAGCFDSASAGHDQPVAALKSAPSRLCHLPTYTKCRPTWACLFASLTQPQTLALLLRQHRAWAIFAMQRLLPLLLPA